MLLMHPCKRVIVARIFLISIAQIVAISVTQIFVIVITFVVSYVVLVYSLNVPKINKKWLDE